MKNILIALLLLFFLQPLIAQREETLFGRNHLDLTGFWYTNTNNFSFFEEDTEYFSGGSVLFEFNKDIFLGWGWQRISGDGRLPSDGSRFDLKHNGLMIAYSPNAGKVIHPHFSVYGGSGRFDLVNSDRERIFALQPAAGLELNVFRWFRLGLEGGYRFITDIDTPGVSSSELSTPFAQLQFRFGYSWWD